MSAGYLDLFIEQGEDFSASISLDNYNNTIFNLNNYIAKADISQSYWSANTTASFSTVIDANNGIVTISLDADTTQTLIRSKYVYDLFLTNSLGGERSKVLEGMIYIEPSVTKI
jgi:hypothetical protein